MIGYNCKNLTVALLLIAAVAAPSFSAFAETSTTSSKPAGRYEALQAGANTFGNFLWVLDTVTGKVVAYRIASVKDAKGNLDSWVTEQLLTEEEYARYLQSQNK
jgi:hypothetical protein